MLLYLTDEFELVSEIPNNKLTDVILEESSYNGNTKIEYIFQPSLSINDWNLNSITIYRMWNESYILNIMVTRALMTVINLKDAIGNSHYIAHEKWFNKGNTVLGLNSQILRKVVALINTIPCELLTKKGIELYYDGLNCCNVSELSKFYHQLIDNRRNISESDIVFLEQFFINKMDNLLNIS